MSETNEALALIEVARAYLTEANYSRSWREPIIEDICRLEGDQITDFVTIQAIRWKHYLVLPSDVDDFGLALRESNLDRARSFLNTTRRMPHFMRVNARSMSRLLLPGLESNAKTAEKLLEILGRISASLCSDRYPLNKNWPFFPMDVLEIWSSIALVKNNHPGRYEDAEEMAKFSLRHFPRPTGTVPT
jgi:hypothetical protein